MEEDDDSSSDEEIETTNKPLSSASKPIKHDIIMRPSASESDPSGGASRGVSSRAFFKSTKSKFPMYPHHEEKIRWDDYGKKYIEFGINSLKLDNNTKARLDLKKSNP